MSRLHYAARRGLIGELLEGISCGLDLNERTPKHFTALMLAAQEGHADVISVLLKAGADPLVAHPNGRTTLHMATHSLASVRVLVEAGVPPDTGSPRSQSPALEAAMVNQREVAEYLLSKGADPTRSDRDGRTVQDWLDLGGIMGLDPGPFEPSPKSGGGEFVRELMARAESVEEFAARHGRSIMIFSYPTLDLSNDAEADAWAARLYEILGSESLMAQCEDDHLIGEELERAQVVRERRKRAEERRAAREARRTNLVSTIRSDESSP